MASKRFIWLLILRVSLLAITMALMLWLLTHYQLLFVSVFLLLLLAGQLAELIHFVNRTNRELQKFIDALRYGDYSVSFAHARLGASFKGLEQSFTAIIETLKSSKAALNTQAELMKLALENIQMGLIIVNDLGQIELMNVAARKMLNLPHFKEWSMVQKKRPHFTSQLGDLQFEGRRLVEMNTPSGAREFFIDINHISLLHQHYHLISFSDLKNEIEQKEIEAWHKLIRILSHEVMNSVTPVTSLSETVRSLLTNDNGEAIAPEELDKARINDMILALDTVIRRSKGMLNFVEDYRKLTRLPAPHFEVISIKDLFRDVRQLMQATASEKNLVLHEDLQNKSLALKADRKMIEQILINLISNAIHALNDTPRGQITLSASVNESNLCLRVIDNGPGIDEDILPSIFIPFFSTRKDGTGIGLTLSKNIMRLHKGSINVSSQAGQGTSFILTFAL